MDKSKCSKFNRHTYKGTYFVFNPLKTKWKYVSVQCSAIFWESVDIWKVARLRPFYFLVRAACRWRWGWTNGGIMLTGENRLETRQEMYVVRKIDALSCNHCRSRKAVSFIHCEGVYVVIRTHHAMRMRHVAICCLASYTTFFSHDLIKGTIFGKPLWNRKCVFWFSLQLSSETFFVLRRIERDMIKKIYILAFT
jgi:hypothetical protein